MLSDETKRIVKDYALVLGGALVLSLLIRFFLIEAYRVPSGVMSPELEPGDSIFVSKVAYGFRPWGDDALPELGDIVVFANPLEGGAEFVRRVVGLPGDRIELRDGVLFRNGRSTREGSPAADGLCHFETIGQKRFRICGSSVPLASFREVKVQEGDLFVLGDGRGDDPTPGAPEVGQPVGTEYVRGKVLWIWLSIEPRIQGEPRWFSRIRFDRMFRRV